MKRNKVILGVGIAAGIGTALYFLLNKKSEQIYAPTDINSLRAGITGNEAKLIAQEVSEETSQGIINAQAKLLDLELSASQNMQQIKDLEARREELVIALAALEKQENLYKESITQADDGIATRKTQMDLSNGRVNTALNDYNDSLFAISEKEMALSERETYYASLGLFAWLERPKVLEQIAEINSELAALRSESIDKEIIYNNKKAEYELKLTEYNNAVRTRDGRIETYQIWRESNITPVNIEIAAVQSTIQQFAISYAVSMEHIIQLKKAIGIELTAEEIAFGG